MSRPNRNNKSSLVAAAISSAFSEMEKECERREKKVIIFSFLHSKRCHVAMGFSSSLSFSLNVFFQSSLLRAQSKDGNEICVLGNKKHFLKKILTSLKTESKDRN